MTEPSPGNLSIRRNNARKPEVIDIATGEVEQRESYEYQGPVARLKAAIRQTSKDSRSCQYKPPHSSLFIRPRFLSGMHLQVYGVRRTLGQILQLSRRHTMRGLMS